MSPHRNAPSPSTPSAALAPAPPEAEALAQIQERVMAWYGREGRDLPWRRPECSAWGVLVSEIMLQQTPVVRVLPVWREWLDRWPTPRALASASEADAVRAWGRLGYPRRALRLHAAAREITDHHAGTVPAEHDELLALPGIGAYTAAAVSVFAYGHRHAVVDTNVRRVHARLFTGSALPAASLTAAELRLARDVLPERTETSVRWNQAVMELGALVCTARSARCTQCPVAEACAWRAAGFPPAERVPRAQAWHGTDRQVRGAIMAVLRASESPVPRDALVCDRVGAEHIADRMPRPHAAAQDAFETLWALPAPPEQRERALTGLLADGLARGHDDAVGLPE